MCGIFGVYNSQNLSRDLYLGIYALQHRGQEGVGLAFYQGKSLKVIKREGLILEALKEEDLKGIRGKVGIAHVRYSTSGEKAGENLQPIVRRVRGKEVALAHNGNLKNYLPLKEKLKGEGYTFNHSSDSEVFLVLMERGKGEIPFKVLEEDEELLSSLLYALREVRGAYNLLMLYEGKLVALRDPLGFRPLCVGLKGKSLYFSSESVSLTLLGAEYLREVKPGEIVVVDERGIRSYHFNTPDGEKKCAFEFVYFARPDSYVFGRSVYEVRKEIGKILAQEDDVEGDLVVPVPDSGLVPALGYAQEKKLPLELGLIRNHYAGRSFIEPTQRRRDLKVLMKLSPNEWVLKGKRIILIDDSIVRGTTSKRIVQLLKGVGVKEIHLRVASPPVISPCYYGIDTPTYEELIANKRDLEGIREYLGVDSLKYVSLEGFKRAIGYRGDFCLACWTNQHPL